MPRGCWTHSVRRMCQGVPLRTCTRKFQGAVKFQIMIHGRIPPDLLKSLLELEASCSPAKQRQNISWPWPNCWLAVGFQKCQSVESMCQKISAPVHAPCQIPIRSQISTSENATPQLSGWNIKTAKLQSALAICCGRQRTAKCFVKSTRVRKPPNENAFGMGWLPPCHQFKSYHLHLHVDGWLLLVFVHPPGQPGTIRNAFVHCFPVY